jgi:hypothetical protein
MRYLQGMRQLVALTFCAGLAVAPVAAVAQGEDGGSDVEEGFSLFEEGARLILRGLMAEMEPALRDLERVIEGLDAYEAPEVLPNGDIIIRRKRPLEPEGDIEVDPGGEVEL